LFPLCLFAESSNPKDKPIQRKDTTRVTVYTYVHHISDLDFRDLDYKIELWLYLTSKDSLSNSLAEQIQVKDAKDLKVCFIPLWKEGKKIGDTALRDQEHFNGSPYFRRILKITCTMIQNWDVDGYPFDKDTLRITIFNMQSLRWFKFDRDIVNYSNFIHKDSHYFIENGWTFNQITVKPGSIRDIFESDKKYSSLNYQIPIEREQPWSLFFKLFIGMYAAVIVAFIALFIPVKDEEPRFGLPVGALFAAIANNILSKVFFLLHLNLHWQIIYILPL